MQQELRVGDNLPSINEANAKYGVSRDTVFKAYKELKRRGLIDSNPMKGYFVKGEVNHILLLLDLYSPYKQNLYNRFVDNLPAGYQVDLLFHQYNPFLFDTIVRESAGRYSMYVVMNISDTKFADVLRVIPRDKLLLLDFGNFDKTGYSYICQNFDVALYDCLKIFTGNLRRYRKFSLIFPEYLYHPSCSKDSFIRFCEEVNMAYEVVRDSAGWRGVEKNTIYLCIQSEDMVRVLKDGDDAGLKVGVDFGLISYNESPILEVIKDGITSIGIDFGLMGEKAAEFVRNKVEIREYLPANLIIRKSV